MTSQEFDANIRASRHFLTECGLMRGTTALQSHSASDEFVKLVLTADTPYREVFLCGLRNSDYNFLLNDFAFLQFTFFSKKHYRFAYYPNPFVSDQALIQELDAALNSAEITYEDYSEFVAQQPYEITKPPIRFELDNDAYVRLCHPAAHFHIGNFIENRWPVYRELTPRSFCLLIVKLYYSENWQTGSKSNLPGGFTNAFDQYYNNEKASCKFLGAPLFHVLEKGQIYFS
jgi:hypothetical protein